MTPDYIRENYLFVTAQLENALARAGRRDKPLLLAAVKYARDEELLALQEAGIAAVGENRVQQWLAHKPLYRPGLPVHFIGTLQKNKVKYIVGDVAMIHSLDSVPLAEEIERQAARHGRVIPVLIEINSAGEESKSGVLPSAARPLLETLLTLPHVSAEGVMTLGPRGLDEAGYRRLFAGVRELAFDLWRQVGLNRKPLLSMGMSESFAAGVLEGADIVRVGRRFFAGRPETTETTINAY